MTCIGLLKIVNYFRHLCTLFCKQQLRFLLEEMEETKTSIFLSIGGKDPFWLCGFYFVYAICLIQIQEEGVVFSLLYFVLSFSLFCIFVLYSTLFLFVLSCCLLGMFHYMVTKSLALSYSLLKFHLLQFWLDSLILPAMWCSPCEFPVCS